MAARTLRRIFGCQVVTLALAATCAAAGPPGTNGPAVGSRAPAFALPGLQGKVRSLAEVTGTPPKPLVLNFWAFWCDTWKDELPHLEVLAGRRKELGFEMVAVSVDGTRMPEFRKHAARELPFPVLLDPGGKVSAAYNVHRVPTVVVIDSKGVVRYIASGYPGNQAVLNWLRKLAGEPREAAKPAP